MQNNRIKIYIDSLTNESEYEGPITTQQIKEIFIQEQENYEDFIFFTDDGNTFLYSNTDLVQVDKLYGLSLFQARKFIKQVSTWESKLEQLENIIRQFELDDHARKCIKDESQNQNNQKAIRQQDGMGKLDNQFRIENQPISHSSQINSYIMQTQRNFQLSYQIQRLEISLYEMQLNINQLEDQNTELMMKNEGLSISLNLVKITLEKNNNKLIKCQQQLKEQEKIKKADNLMQTGNEEKLQIEFDTQKQKYQSLKVRYDQQQTIIEKQVEQNLILKQKLDSQNNQHSEQINQFKIQQQNKDQEIENLQNQVNECMTQLQQKQKELENTEEQLKKQIQKLEKSIMDIKNNHHPTESQDQIYQQNQLTLRKQANQIDQLQQDLSNALQNYDDLQIEFNHYLNKIRNEQQKVESKQIHDLKKELTEARIQIESDKVTIQSYREQNEKYKFQNQNRDIKTPLLLKNQSQHQFNQFKFADLGQKIVKKEF